MRKGMIYATMAILLLCSVTAYTKIGDKVLIDTQYANLTVYPHTKVYEDQPQYINITAKAQPGDLCLGAIADDPITDTQLELLNNGGWINLNPYIDHQIKNNKHIYYSTSSLSFAAYQSRLLRLNLKAGLKKFKYDVWAWSPKNGYSCTEAILQDQTNFIVNLDPWYSVTNQTSGFVALTNYSYETTFSQYPASEYIQPYNTTNSTLVIGTSVQYNFNYSFSKPVDFYWNSSFGSTSRYILIERSYFNGSVVQLATLYNAPLGGDVTQTYYYNNGTAWNTIVNYTKATGPGATHTIVNLSFFNNITNTSHWTPNNYTWNVGPADNGYGQNSFQANVTISIAQDAKLAHIITNPTDNFEFIAKLILDSDLGTEYIRINIDPGYYFYYRRSSARARIDGLNGPIDSTNGLTLNIPRLLRFTKIGNNCSWYDANLVYPTSWTLRYNASCSTNWPPTAITLWCEDATCKFDDLLYREIPDQYVSAPYNADPSFLYTASDNAIWANATIQWFKDSTLNAIDYYDKPNQFTQFNRTLDAGLWYVNVTVYDATTSNASNLSQTLYVSVGNLTVNIYDEETQNLITASVDVTVSSADNSYNATTTTGNVTFTELPAGLYIISASSAAYTTRFDSVTITAQSNESVNMYLLNSSNSNNKIITLINDDSAPIENARIVIERQYATDYIKVNEVYTNFEGETTSDFIEDTVYYRFLVYVDDVLVKTSARTFIFSSKTELTIQVAVTDDQLASIRDLLPASGDVTIDNVSGTMRYSYTWAGADVRAGRLVLVQRALTTGDYTLATNESSGAFGTVTLDFNPTASVTYIGEGYLQANTTAEWQRIAQVEYRQNNPAQTFGLLGVMLSFLIVGTLSTLGSSNPSQAIVLYILGFVVVTLIAFMSITWGFISLIAICGGIIIFTRRN